MIGLPDLSGTPWRWIILSQRHEVFCLVDAVDYPWLAEHNWNVSWGSRTPWQRYAKRNVGPSRATIRMHREILKVADPRPAEDLTDLHGDHRNGQTLDNRRANLRWLTPAENRLNVRPRENIPSLLLVVRQLLVTHRSTPMLEEVPF